MPDQTTIRCSSCGSQFNTNVYTIIDVTEEPQAKNLLISGQINTPICPQCGTANVIAAPILYHDPTKELLIAMVPMELNLQKDQQEKAIGDLMNRLPKENFKSYMFSPKRAITMQGVIDQVLEADGITKEMIEAQRQRLELAQAFVEAESPEALEQLLKKHDTDIDESFFQAMTAMAQRMLQAGRQDIAQMILAKQGIIAEKSSYGQQVIQKQAERQQIIQSVVDEIENMDDEAGQEEFIDLAIKYADDEDRLQALVGLIRPVFDYEFFQSLSARIGQAPAGQRDKLETLRQTLLDLTAAIDHEQQQAAQNAAGFLQAVLQQPQPEEMIRANAHMIDDTFIAVLEANIQHAQQHGNVQASTKLQEIYQSVINILQETMQPELRFINELLTQDDETKIHQMIAEVAPEYGEGLLEVMDAVEQILVSQGNMPMIEKLQALKSQTQAVLSQV